MSMLTAQDAAYVLQRVDFRVSFIAMQLSVQLSVQLCLVLNTCDQSDCCMHLRNRTSQSSVEELAPHSFTFNFFCFQCDVGMCAWDDVKHWNTACYIYIYADVM